MPVCITGMHRSGTSMVTRLLNLCGVYLGEENVLIKPDPVENPEGFWENRRFVRLNDEILAKLGSAWDLPPRNVKGWENKPDLIPLRNKATDILDDFKDHELWGWKDPRNCLTIPFWKNIVSDLKFVICIRNPLEVAMSLHKRNYNSYALGFNLWLTYNQRFLSDTNPEKRIVTHYDSYFLEPKGELKRILDFLGISVTEETIEFACSKINSSLRHQIAESGNNKIIPSKVNSLYKKLCTASIFHNWNTK